MRYRALIGLLLLAIASPVRTAATPETAALDAQIVELRVAGHYADASAVARTLLELVRHDPDALPHEIADAEWRVASLDRIVRVPGAAQKELARADRLEQELRTSVAYNVAGGGQRAEEWLALVQRVLGTRCRELLSVHTQVGGYHYFDGNLEASETHFRAALDLAHAFLSPDHPSIAHCLSDLAIPVILRGDLAQGEALLRDSMRRLRRGGAAHTALALEVMINLSALLERRGDDLGAAVLAKSATDVWRDTAAARGVPPVSPGLLNRLARIDRRQGNVAGAEAQVRESIRLHADPDYANPSLDLSASYLVLGELCADRGEYARALDAEQQALAICETMKGSLHTDVAKYLVTMANTHLQNHDAPAAETLCRRAVAINREHLGASHPQTCQSLRLLGLGLESQSRLDEAATVLAQAAAAFDVARLGSYANERAALPLSSPYPDLARVQLQRGRHADAWVAAERGLARTLADLLTISERRSRDPQDAERERDLARKLAQLERAVDALQSAAAPPDAERAGHVHAELLEAEAQWAALQSELAAADRKSGANAFELARIQAALPARAALIGWVEAAEHGVSDRWGYVIRASGLVRWARSPHGGDSHGGAAALRAAIDAAASWPARVPMTADVSARAEALWQELLAPLLPHLDGVEALCVLASTSVLGVPIEAARSPDGEWAVDRFAISYAPSATVYALLRAQDARVWQSEAPAMALLVGDPPFARAPAAPGSAARTPVPDAVVWRSALAGNQEALDLLPPLPGSRAEVAGLEQLLPRAHVLLGAQASEQALAELATSGALHDFRILHFATHALVDDRAPDRSAVVLSRADLPDPVAAALAGERVFDGLVSAREILREWQLDADLVTLSGCRTGLGKHAAGEGYLGLANALLQVGARSTLVSLWAVEDRAAALLMERFYRNLTGAGPGIVRNKAEALREAKRWLRDHEEPDGTRPFAHPVYWSPFVLIGDSR